jgi:hypothetical protein
MMSLPKHPQKLWFPAKRYYIKGDEVGMVKTVNVKRKKLT